MLRTMQTSEDRSVYDKVVNAIFDEEMLRKKNQQQHAGRVRIARDDTSSIQFEELATELRDCVIEIVREVFKQHCAKHLEIRPVRLLDDSPQFSRLVLPKCFCHLSCLVLELALTYSFA